MITRNFESEELLRQWLQGRKDDCKGGREFAKWLESCVSAGNEIKVAGQKYNFENCMEILKQTA